jgi:hypothetical protein
MNIAHNNRGNGISSMRRTVLALMTLMVVLLLSVASVIGWVDTACRLDIDTWMPLYPHATEMTVQYDFLRPRALGRSYIVYQTQDNLYDVQLWYIKYRQDMVQGFYTGSQPDIPLRGIADVAYYVRSNVKGEGNLIYYLTACAYDDWTQRLK